ncbi:hypothetical protein Mal65_41860 [Crateriforma conspicua]|nr:hypothetical protein Mal65_41860 [Crateriforma conspicua]
MAGVGVFGAGRGPAIMVGPSRRAKDGSDPATSAATMLGDGRNHARAPTLLGDRLKRHVQGDRVPSVWVRLAKSRCVVGSGNFSVGGPPCLRGRGVFVFRF